MASEVRRQARTHFLYTPSAPRTSLCSLRPGAGGPSEANKEQTRRDSERVCPVRAERPLPE
jgi:hypothetical protein